MEGRIEKVTWTDGPKTESDQQWQRWIGYALAIGGIIVAIRLVLVLSARLTLSDSGLQVGSRPLIPFDAISALQLAPAGGTACIELEYSLAGGSHRVRLDGYLYKRLPEIVASICERKGLPNPWPSKTAGNRGA